MFALYDRIQETCNAPGVSAIALQGAVTAYRPFSFIGNGNQTTYAIADTAGPNWEVGIGTYNSAGNTLTRTTVLASSNGGALTNFNSGTQNVWSDVDSTQLLLQGGNATVNNLTVTGTFAGPAPIASLSWIDYVSNWSSVPSLVTTISDGDVWQYTYASGVIRYRLVPSGALQDSFYTTFSGGVLTGLVVNRGMTAI